jgi:hypothetical protein
MQASGSMELIFCDQNLFKLQLAFSHFHEGFGTETPWAGQYGQQWEAFFFIIILKILSTMCHV